MVERKYGERLIIGCRLCGFKYISQSSEPVNVNISHQKPGQYDFLTITKIYNVVLNSRKKNREKVLDNFEFLKEQHRIYSSNCCGKLQILN